MNLRVYNALRKVAGLPEDLAHIRDGWRWSHLLPWSSPSVPAPTAPIPSAVARHNKVAGPNTLKGHVQQVRDFGQNVVDTANRFREENPDIAGKVDPRVFETIERGNEMLQRQGAKIGETIRRNPGLEKAFGAAKRRNWFGLGGNK